MDISEKSIYHTIIEGVSDLNT